MSESSDDGEVPVRGMLQFSESLIPKFSGQDKAYTVSTWIRDIDDNGEVFGWTPTQRLLVARRSLTGTAALWLRSEKVFAKWDDLKGAIKREFPDTIDSKTIHELMSARRKGERESCIDYMFTMKALGKQGKIADYVAIKYIVDGIQDDEQNKVILYGIKNYADLKEKLLVYEEMRTKQTAKSVKTKQDGNIQASSSKSRPARSPATRCYACGEKDHIITECPHKAQGRKCFNCNLFGHLSAECKLRKMADTNQLNQHKPVTEHQRRANYGNRRYDGSTARDELHSKKVYFNSVAASSTMYGGEETERNIPSIPVQNNTGDITSASTIGHSGETSKMASEHRFRDVMIMQNVNKPILHAEIGSKPLKNIRISDKVLLALVDSGSDVNLLSIERYRELQLPACYDDSSRITMIGFGHAQVKSFGKITTRIEIDGNVYDETVFYLVPKDCMPFEIILGNEFLCNVVTVMKGNSVWMNPSSEWLNDVKCFSCSIDCLGHVSDASVKEKVTKLVENYTPCQTKEAPIELKLILKDDAPVAQRPRRISLKEQEEVDKQIQEWLNDGIIRVSFSEYSSPLVLVRKKDGSLRVCVDYRKINSKIVKDEYPLPLIEDHIDKLASAKIFSALDLKNGFFHLRVHKESIKYTSFVTMTSQYEFLRAPFGLSTCPKVFTRFITIIFRELIAQGIVIVFIDDVLIPAENEQQAAERLAEVLKISADYGLQINWRKCQLLVRKVEYLGHVIENGSVTPSPGKTDAVTKFPEPQNVKQLQSFVGLCSYFRKFIPNFAMIAQPLTDLMKKDAKFMFTEEHRNVFKELKMKLATAPVLRIFNPGAETQLHTDASSVAYSAILMQKHDDCEFHPVHYMSRRTTPAESRYTSYELEALAIIEGVKKFRHYLYGRLFKIVTDCKAFQLTLNKKDLALSTRVARWVLLLQDYTFTIEHRDGTRMRHADALSRNPYVAVITSDFHSDVRRAQESDEGLNAIMKILNEGTMYKDYTLRNGLLYKGAEQQLVIPTKMETEIIRRAHDHGHFAKKKTLELISKDYYIDNIGKKVEEYITTCIPCLLANKKEGKQEGYLNPIDKGDSPLSTLHLDHVGPMTDTRKQYNHILTMIDAFTKFVWLFPCKSTSTAEVLNKLRTHQQTFGNPDRIITDRGTAFTSQDFHQYCEDENIECVHITTGVPRSNGQVERIQKIIVPILTKLCIEKPGLWYRHVGKVQMVINSTYQRSVGTTPFEMLIGKKMRRQEEIEIYNLLQQEERDHYMQDRDELRIRAKQQILKVQEENKKTYDKHRKDSARYQLGEVVAIKRTQFGPGLKLKPKYFGPYRITKVKRLDRYDVEKADPLAEGPSKTSTSADHMKRWPDATESVN